ncbi:3-isopropylmalate dehydratase small subunit [Deltaproteobacteria bacterium]|nr:3-isopropylmalate dehydratase small subunit [Deltaproteobacteria bacterium]
MSMLCFTGPAKVVGDDINTDYIISSRRKRDNQDMRYLAQYFMEDLDPGFAARVRKGDILVAGKNFGCGSAMEVAATVMVGVGIPAIAAKSFSRTYFRNAINNGILPACCDTSGIREDHMIEVKINGGVITVNNLTSGDTLTAGTLAPSLVAILREGGLVPYIDKYKKFAMD